MGISWSEEFNLADNKYKECAHATFQPYINTWKAITKNEMNEKGSLQDTLQADWAINKLRELAPDAKMGAKPFFLPFDPYCPINMPEIEQKHPTLVGGIHEIQDYWD